jgi:glutathione S-transferase
MENNNKLKIVGSYLSPYVRKVLVCMELKGIEYEVDPIVPFYGSAEFGLLSPLRRIPVLIDGDVVLSDSTVIAEYLNEKYPTPNLLPADIASRGRARWLEEYADSRLGEVLIWHLYHQLVIRKFVWGQEPNHVVLNKALEHEIPDALDYLESQVPKAGFLFDTISIADIAIASFFRNAIFSRYKIDEQRWPKVCRYVGDLLAMDCFVRLQKFEAICLRTPILEHRNMLKEVGAPVSVETLGGDKPQPGIVAV